VENNRPRTKTLIYAGLALLALLVLSATLNALTLDAGQPLPLQALAPQVLEPGGDLGFEAVLIAIFRVALILAWVIIPLYLLLLLVSKDARKRFVRMLMIYLPIILLLYMLAGRSGGEGALQEISPGGFELGNMEEMAGEPGAPLPEYQPPAPWVTTLTTVLLAAAITLAAAGAGYMLYRRSRRAELSPLQQIQQEAQAALDAIEAGGDLREVIIRSYLQMVQALKQYRNIHRDRDMTPHEFQDYLEKRGLPREPVRQLTQLFEQVRYGGAAPGRQDERAAIASLNAIINACQRTAKT
jgi:hypothetical protein